MDYFPDCELFLEGLHAVNPPSTSDNPAPFDRQMFLDIMREDPPLKRYVSRGDTRDSVDISGPHEEADRAIMRAVRFTMSDKTPRFQPVLAGAGMGKTHLFWVVKDRESYFSKGRFLAVYVPSPPAPVRVPLHIHACIVDEAGESIFDQAVDMLITRFGGLKGATAEHYDLRYAMDRLLTEYPGISADVVKVLLSFRLDPQNRPLARRWLFGEALSEEEIAKLGVRTVLEDDDVTLATLKLLAEGSERPIVLFIDEIEAPYNTHGETGERHFLEVMKRLYNECKNVVMVASCLAEIWDRVYGLADAPMRSRMEVPAHLRNFTREDFTQYVAAALGDYWKCQNMDAPPDAVFPFTEEDIKEAFAGSHGVPRESIKSLIPILERILYGGKKETEVAPQADRVVKLTPSVVVGAITEALSLAGKAVGVGVRLHVAKGGTEKQATAIVILSKAGNERRLCIDVPNVKDWNRSGGVAAFYSVRRLRDVVEAKEADAALIAIPIETKGAKFESAIADMGPKLLTLRMGTQEATNLVDTTGARKLGKLHDEFFVAYLTELFAP
ncbi:MAG: hypothetical protein C4K49_10140 [Candidatus Thorarchaeota archaeon]|nr:MAG: hypothetical protein C4K49_10140 [Candidatus Thorarchaeota archaeon]